MQLFLLILLLFIGMSAGAEEVIYKITFLGNVKVEEGVIRGAIKSREGGPFSTEQVREDLRSIFGLGSLLRCSSRYQIDPARAKR